MQDRLKRGAIAGMLALLFPIAVNLGSYHLLHFAKTRWVDAITQLVYGQVARNPIELALGFFAFFVSAGGLGVLYVLFVVPEPGRGDYLFRGMGWGLGTWFMTYALGTVFKVPLFYIVAWQTAITQVIGIMGRGLIMGWLTRRWDKAFSDKAAARNDETAGTLVQFSEQFSRVVDHLDELITTKGRTPRRVVRRRPPLSMRSTREQIEAKWGADDSELGEHP